MNRDVNPSSPGFCIMPWVHLNVWTDGRIIPCCINHGVSFGNVRQDRIEDAYNSPAARAFRKSMLEGRLPDSCSACAVSERTLGAESMRLVENRKFAKHLDLVAKTEDDGRLPELRFVLLDVRISNLCNFSCRMCNVSNSSEFARDEQRLGRRPQGPTVQKSFESVSDFLKFLDRHLGSLEELYFSGGEALLIEEHYRILEALILWGKTGVNLRYNSNLSRLSFAGDPVTRYWKHFPRVTVGASLDASGARGEYIRKGAVWSEILENRKRMMAEAPHVNFWIASTVQLMNAFNLPEFHLDWIKKGLATASGIDFNILRRPSWFSLQVLTPQLKRKFGDLWMDYIRVLSGYPKTEQVVSEAKRVVQFAHLQESGAEARRKFITEIQAYDALRGESFGEVFPELKEMIDRPSGALRTEEPSRQQASWKQGSSASHRDQ